jgi:ABC-type phosphate/phosphonate transport system substrate-binding protein
VTDRIANARMYAVTPAVEALWQGLLAELATDAEVPLHYLVYPAPQPLEVLWNRADLGAAFMCGYPIALQLAPVTPLAAPIPSAAWAGGRPYYRTDLIVRANSSYHRLEDTFGGRAGWTVMHSHSGFNAFRHHLLAYRSGERPVLYGEMVGGLVTARNVLDAVRQGRIDVGPLDAYWHLLLRTHQPELTDGIRVLAATEPAPMPAFVAAAGMPQDAVRRLQQAFVSAAARPWFAPFGEQLLIEGFAAVNVGDYATTLAWDAQARSAGYQVPA